MEAQERKDKNILNEFKFLGRLADDPSVAEKYTRFPLAVKQDKRNVPNENTDTLLHDLISVSNNSILSVGYQPLDSMIGYSAATRDIKGKLLYLS
ncbi:hypothetical protein [Pseudobutyrivibrio xylanivorans]|uniref:Uncharacterized protein n=1 Tax=Pseudobutyrivibrio xylanivorans TaxID=185007 RepID=A0A5P6VWB1_PSEXY|nr:hypothetical protein [Pseudobutyrivibrio xylanivorans]QFJ56437.1 hypothetical protein FXF36_16135 [Pseudobutyrivibrio xylanivorans]